jgi:hypothetical protein
MHMGDSTAGSSGSSRRADVGQKRSATAPALPYGKAFVVQFSLETDRTLEHATGRIEHLESGRRVPFSSAAELLACIAVMLGDADPAPAEEPPPHTWSAASADF